MQIFWIASKEAGSFFQDANYSRLLKFIINIPAITMGCNQASFTQYHQVLRDTCLAHTEDSFQMANTGFLSSNHHEDLNPGRLTDY